MSESTTTRSIVVNCQYRENYGAHAWDGEGKCPQYWKCKGGISFIVRGVPMGGEDLITDLDLNAVRQFSNRDIAAAKRGQRRKEESENGEKAKN